MSVRAYLASNARNPHVAGLVVAATAAGFTPLWLLVAGGFGGTPGEVYFYTAFFLVGTPVNAYLVTRLAWRRWVAGRPRLGSRRAAAVGAVIGLVSYLTLATAFAVAGSIFGALADPATTTQSLDVLGFLGQLMLVALLGVGIGLVVTAGVPVLLSIGAALLLSQLDRGDPARGDGTGRRVTPRDHVRPPR